MESTYFALGVLSMIAVMFVAVIVIGLVKVMRIEKTLSNLKEHTDNLYRVNDNSRTDLYRVIEDTKKQLEVQIAECLRYTDKRFDKKS